MAELTITPLAARHRADWDRLYAGYAEFYKVAQTPQMRDTVWGWIHDPAHEVNAVVAEDASGRAIGLAHYRAFARPLSASTGCFLDDLFVELASAVSAWRTPCWNICARWRERRGGPPSAGSRPTTIIAAMVFMTGWASAPGGSPMTWVPEGVQPSNCPRDPPIIARNSRRVASCVRNSPSMRDVTMVTPGLCTPRVVMH